MAVNKLENIVKISKANYEILLAGGSVQGYTYDPNALYLVQEDGNTVEDISKAVAEAIYKIRTIMGLDENLNPQHTLEENNMLSSIKELEEANQTVASGFYKLRTELGLDKYLESDVLDSSTVIDSIKDLENANQTIANSFYKVEQKTGLNTQLNLPDDFSYESLVAAINDLKTRVENLEEGGE